MSCEVQQKFEPDLFSHFDVYRLQKTDRQAKYTYKRLTVHCAPIFFYNCEHFLYVYIVKQNKKRIENLKKNFVDFQNLMTINFVGA